MRADVRYGSLGDMAAVFAMSALPPIADIRVDIPDVRFVPIADIGKLGY